MTEQIVRLVFLGEAGQALATQEAVLVGTQRLSAAQKEQAATSRAVAAESSHAASGMRNLERDTGKATRGAIAGSGAFRGLGRSIAFASAGFLGGFGLTFAIRAAVDELHKAAAANAQVEQALRTTGGAAGVTAKQIDVLSQSLLRKTGYDDEAIKSAATLLLSFTEIRDEVGKGNDIYTQAVKLSVDLARRLGEDLPGAAKQLGRALNDPVRGLTTLSRAGIQFTKVQREQIAALVESGHILDAQRIILENVATKVGGAAAAYGRTPAGQLDIFRESLRNLAATYASAFTPEIAKATKGAQEWVDRLEKDPAARKNFQHDIEDAAGALGDIAHVLKQATDLVGGFGNAIKLLVGLKFISILGGWLGGLQTLIGSAGVAAAEGGATSAGTGLLGARAAAGGLFATLAKLRGIGVVTIELELIMHTKLGKEIFGGNFDAFKKWAAGIANGQLTWAQFRDILIGPKIGGGSRQSTGQQFTFKDGKVVLTGNSGGSSVNAKQAAVVATAKKLGPASGGIYVTGGTGGAVTSSGNTDFKFVPGFDCSGYLYEIYKKNGIDIPRTSEAQWADPDAIEVPKGKEQPGDGVYFTGSPKYAPPGHCGIYIGGGRYIEYYQSGKPARISNLADASDYWGARRWIGIKQQGGAASKTKGGAGSVPRKRPPRGAVSGATDIPLNLQEGLARAGTTTTKSDDRSALQAIISFLVGRLKQGGLAQTQRISLLQQEGSYLDQLAGLDPKGKKPSQVSKASLIVIKNTLAEVGKLVDQAGLDKKFAPQLAKINDLLDKKLVTPETLARVRIQLGKIADAAKAALDKAKQQLEARRQAFADAWTQLAADAFAAFDKETSSHVGPTRAILNALISEHDKAAIDQAVTDAKKALDDALAGANASTDSDILSQVRQLVGKAALANAIDKAQSAILGVSPQEISSAGLIHDLQSLLAPGGGQVVDPEAVKQAQRAYDDAVYQQKLFDLGKQADLEDDQYAQARAALRDALQLNLDAWQAYYRAIGADARAAAGDFAAVWAAVLGQFPTAAGGTANTGSASTATKQLSPGFNIPAGVIGAGFGGAFAGGGEGVVAKPTLFLAGESGPERYQFSPLRGGSGGTGTGQTAHTVIHLTGEPLDSLIRSQIIEATPEISIAIGKEASLRARSGRF